MSNQNRTPEERKILDKVGKRKGRKYAEKHAKLILLDARRLGLIDEQ